MRSNEPESGSFDNLFEATRNINEKHSFRMGDQVKLSHAQRNFSKSVPAHAGFTTEQFAWLATLKKYEDATGEITRISPGSDSVNVTFEDGHVIGISADSLERADGEENAEESPNLDDMEEAKDDCSCGADCGAEEGISGRKHRRRMKVREAAVESEFDALLGDKVYKRVYGVPDGKGYVEVNFKQFVGVVPDSDQLYLEDDQGYRYKRVMSPMPEDQMVLFKQL